MGVFEFILGICLVSGVLGIINGGLKIEREKIKARSRGANGETAELRGIVGDMHQEMQQLKDRVRVLERLATDEDRRLADEIERLRRDTRAGV